MSDSNTLSGYLPTDSGGQLGKHRNVGMKQEWKRTPKREVIGLLTHNVIVLLSSQTP